MALPGIWNTIGGEVVVVAIIAFILYVVFKLGKSLFKIIFGIIANSILGLIVIYLVDSVLGLGIPIAAYTLIPTALFGLPGVGTLIILRFFGIPL